MATTYNLAKGFFKLAHSRVLNKRFPLNVFFVVTNKCNLDCYYCYGDYFHRKDFREFTKSEIFGILDTLKKMGTVFLQLQGGEPLLRNDIGDIIDYSIKLGFNTDMISNGLLIKNKIEHIKKLASICISIDGRKELNDYNRGKGTFEKTMAGIDEAVKYIPVRINSVVTADTEQEDIDFLVNMAKDKGILINFCPSFQFKPLIERQNRDHLKLSEEKIKHLLESIAGYKNRGYPIQFTAGCHDISKNWPFTLEKRMAKKDELPSAYKYHKCHHGDYVVFIDSDGQLYPCCNFWNDYKRLNVHEIGFEKAWEGLTREGCEACYVYSYIDRNGLMNFNFDVMWNYFKQSLKKS